jgi:hypothetical protein
MAGCAAPLHPLHGLGEIPKLRIPIGMLAAFPRLDVALQRVAQRVQQLGTTVWLTEWPRSCSATASVRVLLHDHRSGEPGSPAAVGSTNASRTRSRVASRAVAGFRPPPGLRLRPGGSNVSAFSTRKPR